MSKSKIKAIEKLHRKGYSICDSALSEAEELFKCIEDYQHCQTGPDGDLEVIIGKDCGGDVPWDCDMLEALDILNAQNGE